MSRYLKQQVPDAQDRYNPVVKLTTESIPRAVPERSDLPYVYHLVDDSNPKWMTVYCTGKTVPKRDVDLVEVGGVTCLDCLDRLRKNGIWP